MLFFAQKCRVISQLPCKVTKYHINAGEHNCRHQSNGNLPHPSHNQDSTTVSLQDLLEHVGITVDILKQECTKTHLKEISEELDDQWEKYARCLITQREIDDIKEENRKVGEQRYKAFLKWKQQKAFKATYFHLVVNVFLKCNNAEMAEFVCKLLK